MVNSPACVQPNGHKLWTRLWSTTFIQQVLLEFGLYPGPSLLSQKREAAPWLRSRCAPGFQGRGAKDVGVTKKMTIKNASRHYKATAKRHGFAMPIRVSTYVHVEDSETASVSWLRPSDVFRHLLTKYPALVLGGCAANDAAEAMLETLWAHYERNHPTHHVFMDRNVLRRTIPMCLHGDGARSQKKQPLEVVSIESVLGFNSGDCKDCHFDVCNCPTRKRGPSGEFRNPMIQKLNSKHRSYLSKYFASCFSFQGFPSRPSQSIAWRNLARHCARVQG